MTETVTHKNVRWVYCERMLPETFANCWRVGARELVETWGCLGAVLVHLGGLLRVSWVILGSLVQAKVLKSIVRWLFVFGPKRKQQQQI